MKIFRIRIARWVTYVNNEQAVAQILAIFVLLSNPLRSDHHDRQSYNNEDEGNYFLQTNRLAKYKRTAENADDGDEECSDSGKGGRK